MVGLYISLCAVPVLFAAVIGFSYYTYRRTFYSNRHKKYDALDGIERLRYEKHHEIMKKLVGEFIALPYERVDIVSSRDGIRLSARYYHIADGAPIEIQCHGYKSHAQRDFAASGQECRKRGYNLLLIDQRSHGMSEGSTICFGLKEKYDILDWVDYVVDRFGKDCEIILYGISMGAASVIMAAGENPAPNVKGVVADCPYSSAVDIIGKVGSDIGIPSGIVKLFGIIAARVFGGFSLRADSPVEAAARATVPILLIHGTEDSFVPCYMSERIAMANEKITFRKFEGAEHATSYLCDTEGYLKLVDGFVDSVLERKVLK